MIGIAARGIALDFAADLGRIDEVRISDQGLQIAPLHRAPWVGTSEKIPSDEAPLMAGLGGDFFCAPFAAREGASPLHGWPANVAWEVSMATAGTLRAVCSRKVYGATLVKDLRLRDGHPFVYQRHSFVGGQGRVTAANHANLSLPAGGLIRTSAKSHWETPPTQQETDPARGRSRLVSPARAEDPRAFPETGGGTADLTTYPWFDRTEDFVVGVEASGNPLGWTTVTRPATGDLFLSLRNPSEAPMTMLWQSNGGRDYPPWSGRHFGCLGIEEGAAEHMLGISTEADLAGPGALTLAPDATAHMRHVIGAIAWPSAEPVASVVARAGVLEITGDGGARREIPFDTDFLTAPPA